MEAAAEQSSQGGNIAGSSLLEAYKNPMREKTWDECDPARRMEMMREEVRYLRRIIKGMQDTLGRLKFHQHTQTGELMVPLRHREEDGPAGYVYDPLK